ncbi:MAG: NAD(P)/FAD-dependent oxidoreductase, partial [Actinomycetota bacterium]|nr:NAD(P)/FAD-dependent oxidoreductase [Actinomycetota bacterium]
MIVGGGPAGLSAALVLGRQLRRVLVVDSRQPRNQAAVEMHMYLGREGTNPAKFLADGRAELQDYETVEQWEGEIVIVTGAVDGFSLELGDGRQARARRLLLTGGLVDVPYDIDGLAERWGSSVFHCPFCHGHENRDRRLAVIGNGPSASLAAYLADRYSDDVILFTHGPSTVPEQVHALLEARRVR